MGRDFRDWYASTRDISTWEKLEAAEDSLRENKLAPERDSTYGPKSHDAFQHKLYACIYYGQEELRTVVLTENKLAHFKMNGPNGFVAYYKEHFLDASGTRIYPRDGPDDGSYTTTEREEEVGEDDDL